MSTPPTELELFRDFLIEECARGQTHISIEKVVRRFEQTKRLLEKLDIAEAQAERGECRPLNVDEMMSRIEERVAM